LEFARYLRCDILLRNAIYRFAVSKGACVMLKKYWLWVLVAVLCIAVLGVTLWAVLGGVSAQMPQAPEAPPVVEEPKDVEVQPDDENFPMVDESGVVIGGENYLEDPWADIPSESGAEVPQDEVSEIPQDEILTDEDLAVTDEGWSGIY